MTSSQDLVVTVEVMRLARRLQLTEMDVKELRDEVAKLSRAISKTNRMEEEDTNESNKLLAEKNRYEEALRLTEKKRKLLTKMKGIELYKLAREIVLRKREVEELEKELAKTRRALCNGVKTNGKNLRAQFFWREEALESKAEELVGMQEEIKALVKKLKEIGLYSSNEEKTVNSIVGKLIKCNEKFPPPPIDVDNDLEYEVEEVLDSRIEEFHLEYLVHWKGYDISESTWETASNLENAADKVAEFHQQYLDKPKTAPRCYDVRDMVTF